ncbi:BAG family molecular chaperone regulator 1 [Spatholobus suberectus]|nr:BAG family molecular chaperone regulator 1 [Spatholobus suberectus]
MQSKRTHKETTTESTIHNMFSRGRRRDIGGRGNTNVAEWELRPGGMVVQKRNSDGNQNSASKSTIKVKVKYGSSCHEIQISSHASFGELKKMLTEPTGLHVQDQKLIYKKKERDSKSYLDVERVKDGSKLVLLVDVESRERRVLETLKIAKEEKTSKSLKEVKGEVDKLAKKVAALEASASTGGVIAELDIETLTENLMRVLITLDEIYGEGELKLQRREQVRRVQKHIETLDMLRMAKAKSVSVKNEENMARGSKVRSGNHVQRRQGNTAVERNPKKQQQLKHSDSVVVTTKWEIFD